ncbi:MAG: hypothetical protein LBR37_00190 [Erysipelotrichaceae bacterium]|jgi:hypothetical protein|nr:hypothetical protein [Erysipelotrichaceae bacterium]
MKDKKRPLQTILQVLGSLFKNNSALNGATGNPWWVSLVILILTLGCAITPVALFYDGQRGEQYIPAYNNGLEVALADFQIALSENDLDYEIQQKGEGENAVYELNEIGSNTWDNVFGLNETPYKHYHVGTIDADGDGSIDLIPDYEIYFTKRGGAELSSFKDQVLEKANSYFIFGKDAFFFGFLTNGDLVSASSGDYLRLVGTKLSDLGKVYNGDALVDGKTHVTEYQNGVLNNYKQFINKGYLTYHDRQVLVWTLAALGFFFIIVILGGLVIFIGTRSKTSEFRVLSYWKCTKIAIWASLSPALITLILGCLFLQQYAMWMFILLVSLRYMWFSMRTLRPMPTA